MAEQGQYTYTINVKGTAKAIKDQTRFAKEVEKTIVEYENLLARGRKLSSKCNRFFCLFSISNLVLTYALQSKVV